MNRIDVSSLSIKQKVGQMLFIGIPGPEFDIETKQMLADIEPGGICLFARNIKEAEQTRELLDSIHDFLGIVPFLSIDQEGGRVDRLRRILSPMPASSQLRTPDDAKEQGSIIGEALRVLGFNMDFAPVVDVIDVDRRQYLNGLQTRGFGLTKESVVEMAEQFLIGLSENGILGCLKHFPGLAASEVDSHEELPVVAISDEELRIKELYPYRELLTRFCSACVMVAHAVYPRSDLQELDPSGKLVPSSLSNRVVTSLLRGELKFDGVAITDDLEMGAIVRNYGIAEACKAAIDAGVDMLAICADPKSIYDGYASVVEAISTGEISEKRLDESVERIASLKDKLPERITFDRQRLDSLEKRIDLLKVRLN